MSTYFIKLVDDGSGNYNVYAQRGGTAPTGGTNLAFDHVENNNLGTVSSTFTAATNATPVVVTAANTFANGDYVTVSGVVGNTGANGTYSLSNVSATAFTLVESVGNGAWTSGGIALKLPTTKLLSVVAEAAKRVCMNDRAAGN